MNDLGEAIRRARLAAGLLREVERATGRTISGAGLSRIETGQRYPTLRTLEALTAVLPIRLVIADGITTATRRRRAA